jgi:tRNA A-37 threonylcarbamoyl transferase component Bud32
MGAVYRVRDARSGKHLALKRGDARDPKKVEKRQALLEREYHTLAQLAHPCIIEVYDYGVDEQGPYYTMELLDGADLDKRGKLPWQTVCALLRDVASSLAILHSRGLLHRDVSSRNVRCTTDGRAKLLDFGAMVSMGLAKEVVGTPPFVAPEALQMQALDARADLFSLGALGYYLLTSRHAFHARRLSELRDTWRSAPTPPIRLVPELPVALSNLILQLLSLDRSARPQSAAEVMERLCAIAGLPMEERAEVSRAYLSTPTLIGREPALLAVRKRLLSLVRGDGGTLLIEGAPGSGRSRLLDACVLEGKLLGATVLRADQSDGASGDWGVARTLCAQLFELLPDAANEAARLSRHVIGYVFEALRDEERVSVPERSLLLRELRDFFLSVRGHRLFLVIDDADRIDEPSAALLAALAHKTEKHSLMLAIAANHESDTAASASVRLMRSVALSVELPPLDADQTEALVRSVFGDVASLRLVSGRIHALSHGNPRTTMELAQHLVDSGLARYQAGSWSLPSELDEGDLPPTLSASLATRLVGLSPDARELANMLCLADGDPLTLADYPALTGHKDSGRVFRALDQLVAARILLADAERYRFSQRGFVPVLEEALGEPARTEIHARLAELLSTRGLDLLRRAHHLLHGGRDREGVELLCSFDLQARPPPLPLTECALEASVRLGLPARTIHQLRSALLRKAPMVMAVDTFHKQFPFVLAQLEHDSGLAFFRELSELPLSKRLEPALTRAQERYLATPEHDRVYSPIDAIRELARFSASACSLGMQIYDLEFIERLPSLEPLLPLSPALAVVGQMIAACKDALGGRTLVATHAYEAVLARLAQPDRAGFDETYYRGIRLGIHYLLGLVDASMGMASAEKHAQLLEADREHRVNAWRVRVSLHLNQGNAEEARKCMRRAELLQLQEGDEQRYIGTSAGFELIAHAMIGDLIGVKRALDAVATLAEHYPGWRPALLLGQCHYHWLQGDLQRALEILLPAFALAPVGRHPYFPYLAAAHIGLLGELERVSEAVQIGGEYLEVCRRERLGTTDRWVQLAVALALARAGENERAQALIDEPIAAAEALGMVGLSLGALYEARARMAIWSGEQASFEQYAERCAGEYRKGRNPALSARFGRLMEEARQRHVGPEPPPPEPSELLGQSQTETGFETIQSRLLECVDQNDRARCALTIILQSMDSFAGHLFGVNEHAELQPLASLPEVQPDEGLSRWLQASLELELESQVSATATADGEDEDEDGDGEPHSEIATRYTDLDGRTFEPIFLSARGQHDHRIAAVLALNVQPGPRSIPPKELLAEIASQLLEHGDVSGFVI